MADNNKLNLGIQSTEEFNLEDDSLLEDFLNGDTSKLEKIDPKKEKKEPVKKDPKASKEKTDEDEEEQQVEEEEEIDILEVLENEEETDDEEEEDKSKAKKPAAKTEEVTDDTPAEDNQFEVISRQLYEMGIFQHDGDEDAPVASSGEELAALFQHNAQQAALRNLDSFLRSRGDDRMDLFEAIFVNGVDPKEYIPTYNRVQDFENLDISTEDNQERVVREYYKRLKWNESAIEKKIQKLKDYGDLEEEAGVMHPQIVEQDKEALEQQKLQKKTEEETKKQNEQAYHGGVQKILQDALKSKELNGIPVTEKQVREAAAFMLTPKYRLPSGETLSEYDKFLLESKKPENLKDRIVFALLKMNGFDLTKVKKEAISKETNQLFAGLKKTAVKKKTDKVVQNKDDFWNL